jgi:hypothetical protein
VQDAQLHAATAAEHHLPAGMNSSAAGAGKSILQEGRYASHHEPEQHWLVEAGYLPLTARQPLFARKFPAKVQGELLEFALSCAGLGLGDWCP